MVTCESAEISRCFVSVMVMVSPLGMCTFNSTAGPRVCRWAMSEDDRSRELAGLDARGMAARATFTCLRNRFRVGNNNWTFHQTR